MIFVVQKLLMPATLHLMIQGCKEVRIVPDLCAAFSAVRIHLPSSFHIRPGRNPGSETLCSQGAGWGTGFRNRKTGSWATWGRGGSLFGRKCLEEGTSLPWGSDISARPKPERGVCAWVRVCMYDSQTWYSQRGKSQRAAQWGRGTGRVAHGRCALTVSKSTTVRRKWHRNSPTAVRAWQHKSLWSDSALSLWIRGPWQKKSRP